MTRFRCNSCAGTYSDRQVDGSLYYHVCSPEVITPAEFDAAGKLVKEEQRTHSEHIRNENPVPDLVVVDGKMMRAFPHPEERGQVVYKPAQFAIVSEGLGRVEVHDG